MVYKIKTFKKFLAEAEFTISDNKRSFWWKIVQDARNKFKINFDLENLDAGGHSKIKEYKGYIYQLWYSSGDWETPSILFCCQKKNGADKDCFAFIPNKDEGNFHLVKSDTSDNWIPLDDQDKIKADPIKCEKALKQYLDKLNGK